MGKQAESLATGTGVHDPTAETRVFKYGEQEIPHNEISCRGGNHDWLIRCAISVIYPGSTGHAVAVEQLADGRVHVARVRHSGGKIIGIELFEDDEDNWKGIPPSNSFKPE